MKPIQDLNTRITVSVTKRPGTGNPAAAPQLSRIEADRKDRAEAAQRALAAAAALYHVKRAG